MTDKEMVKIVLGKLGLEYEYEHRYEYDYDDDRGGMFISSDTINNNVIVLVNNHDSKVYSHEEISFVFDDEGNFKHLVA